MAMSKLLDKVYAQLTKARVVLVMCLSSVPSSQGKHFHKHDTKKYEQCEPEQKQVHNSGERSTAMDRTSVHPVPKLITETYTEVLKSWLRLSLF